MGATSQQPNSGVAGQIPSLGEVDLAVGEQRVDLVGSDFHLLHTRPAGRHDVLRVVFVSGQADCRRFDPKGNVLADQGNPLALGG
jgi:hypothetical protein